MPIPEGFEKVKVKIVGEDGNIFFIMARASKALKNAGHDDLAKEMRNRVMESHSYDLALQAIFEYVDDIGWS